MLERILIKILPNIWKSLFNKIEKQDLITQALKAAYKQKLLRATWTPFVKSVQGWLRDGLNECQEALKWPD